MNTSTRTAEEYGTLFLLKSELTAFNHFALLSLEISLILSVSILLFLNICVDSRWRVTATVH